MRKDENGQHFCEICNGLTDPEFICDDCGINYCDDCSYMFTYHYTYQGSQCYFCADQNRKYPLKNDRRNNTIDAILNKS